MESKGWKLYQYLQQKKGTESVTNVPRCSDTLAASMTYLSSAYHSYIKNFGGKTLKAMINSLDDCSIVEEKTRRRRVKK